MTHEQAVNWMAEHGHPEYALKINALHSDLNEIIGDAGRYWAQCKATCHAIGQIKDEISEIRAAAWDRWYDWSTDYL